MTLIPTQIELKARAQSDLRMGLPVVLGLGGAYALIASAETVSSDRRTNMAALGGPLVLAITARRAETLKARVYSGGVAQVRVPDGADCAWIRAVADPALDLGSPMKGPLESQRDGNPALADAALRLAKAAQLLPAALMLPLQDGPEFAVANNLTLLRLDGLDLVEPASLHPVAAARLPMQAFERGRLSIYRPGDGGEEHYSVQIGQPMLDAPILVRLHSACFTGDVLGSLKCDCGPQLHAALAQMGEEGAGVLLYLNQEGRGIGLANKMRAYALQDQGFDTVEANHRLGFEDDERDFRLGAAILREMGITRVRLMTNNPAKVAMLEANGLNVVERVPLKVGQTAQNRGYLETKRAKSGHLL